MEDETPDFQKMTGPERAQWIREWVERGRANAKPRPTKPLTVRELIEKLKELNPEAEVWMPMHARDADGSYEETFAVDVSYVSSEPGGNAKPFVSLEPVETLPPEYPRRQTSRLW
jgi:hypothetical protein